MKKLEKFYCPDCESTNIVAKQIKSTRFKILGIDKNEIIIVKKEDTIVDDILLQCNNCLITFDGWDIEEFE